MNISNLKVMMLRHWCISILYLTLIISVKELSALELNVPLISVYGTSSKSITTEEFITLSYQPLLVTGALSEESVVVLRPWDFAHLSTSLEAATTFCTAGSGKDNLLLQDVENSIKKKKKEKKQQNENDKDKRLEMKKMSLRRFALESQDVWSEAFANITKDMGMMVKLPMFLEDFEFDHVETVGLHYTRKGWSSQLDRRIISFSGSSVVCLLEGRRSFILTPYELPWELLECGENQCTVNLNEEIADDVAQQIFLTRVDLESRDCLYVPLEWYWHSSTAVDSISLVIKWEEDITVREDVLEAFLAEENNLLDEIYKSSNEEPNDRQHRSSKSSSKEPSMTLWEVLPRTFWRSPVLWSDKNPLLHLVRFYLLTTQERNLTQFLRDFRVDRGILPDLVDCPRECEASAKRIFTLLDTDLDGVLTRQDAIYLTQETFTALTLQMDDLVDELKELGMEQWVTAVEGRGDNQFFERAKDRMQEGAKSTMRRLVAGDTDKREEQEMKEKLPGLYADVMAAREAKNNKLRKEEL